MRPTPCIMVNWNPRRSVSVHAFISDRRMVAPAMRPDHDCATFSPLQRFRSEISDSAIRPCVFMNSRVSFDAARPMLASAWKYGSRL